METTQELKVKLQAIKDEVKVFHPFLEELFRRVDDISRVDYKHGVGELGTDFVLTRLDKLLGTPNYIGLVVKTGKILQSNVPDVSRQINEAFNCEKTVADGSQKVRINSVWVICNGRISENAQNVISGQYLRESVEFIGIEHLVKLTNENFPEYAMLAGG